jgi:hypothetical protein
MGFSENTKLSVEWNRKFKREETVWNWHSENVSMIEFPRSFNFQFKNRDHESKANLARLTWVIQYRLVAWILVWRVRAIIYRRHSLKKEWEATQVSIFNTILLSQFSPPIPHSFSAADSVRGRKVSRSCLKSLTFPPWTIHTCWKTLCIALKTVAGIRTLCILRAPAQVDHREGEELILLWGLGNLLENTTFEMNIFFFKSCYSVILYLKLLTHINGARWVLCDIFIYAYNMHW